MTGFTFGADPEIFITKKTKPVSAFGVIEGTKESPFPTSNGAYQVDGMAVEFNIAPTPANNFTAFNLNVVKTLKDLKEAIGGHAFSKVSVQEFDPEYLESQPDAAKELGCDPDYSAYTLEPNPRPDGKVNFRTGAGHLHVGWGADIPVDNEEHLQICANFVKALDATVGVFMTYLDREPRRRELYGKAGAFRPKPYGVEYRTPSNAWIWNKDTRQAIHYFLNQGITNMRFYPDNIGRWTGGLINTEEELQTLINSGDHETAKRIIESCHFGPYSGMSSVWKRVKASVEKEV